MSPYAKMQNKKIQKYLDKGYDYKPGYNKLELIY